MKNETKSRENLPLFDGFISAGFPSMGSEDIDARLDINDYIVENKTATYFIRVKGDSMEGAGIYDKDILVVDRSKEIHSGKIIIAYLNGEFTVKRLLVKNGKQYLLAENPKYAPITITEACDFEIFGAVTFNIHKPL